MNRTPREHFEEIDWLDHLEGQTDPEMEHKLQGHLVGCTPCRDRLDSLKRLVCALPTAREMLAGDPELSNVVPFPEPEISDAEMERIVTRARQTAERELEKTLADRREVESFFASAPLAGPADFFGLGEKHLVALSQIARETFRSDVGRAGDQVEWGFLALSWLRSLGKAGTTTGGVEGLLRTLRANSLRVHGKSTEALAELDRARPLLEEGVPFPEEDLAYWSFVRAGALMQKSRYEEALHELDEAETVYELFQEQRWSALCQIYRAVIYSEMEQPGRSVEIYRSILAEGCLGQEARLLASAHINLAADLVAADRLSEARSAYASTIDHLKKNGMENLLFRVRAGLAEIAVREQKLEDALEIHVQLRPEFRSRNLAWDIVDEELKIAELYLKLERHAEAADTCRALLPVVQAAGLDREAQRAVNYLVEAEGRVNVFELRRVRKFVRGVEKGVTQAWSAA
jgi:tetratricopeptide (TPR) repeat protein